MRQIGIVSATLNAVVPLMASLIPVACGESRILRNYVDEGLQELVQREGCVIPTSIARLTRLINSAIEDGSDAILLTCTVFSPYVETIQPEAIFNTHRWRGFGHARTGCKIGKEDGDSLRVPGFGRVL